jgi:hypothetical protein
MRKYRHEFPTLAKAEAFFAAGQPGIDVNVTTDGPHLEGASYVVYVTTDETDIPVAAENKAATPRTVKALYKTTIVIWSDYDPATEKVELAALARDAENGESYCSFQESERIEDPAGDPQWDGTEFFGVVDEESENDPDHFKCAGCENVSIPSDNLDDDYCPKCNIGPLCSDCIAPQNHKCLDKAAE